MSSPLVKTKTLSSFFPTLARRRKHAKKSEGHKPPNEAQPRKRDTTHERDFLFASDGVVFLKKSDQRTKMDQLATPPRRLTPIFFFFWASLVREGKCAHFSHPRRAQVSIPHSLSLSETTLSLSPYSVARRRKRRRSETTTTRLYY